MTSGGRHPSPDLEMGAQSGERSRRWSARVRLRDSHWPIAVLLGFGILVGALIVTSYGVSWDEPDEAALGADALKAYSGSQDYFNYLTLAEHGPVYFMFFSATSDALTRIFPNWLLPDGRHFTNYLTFLAGVACFYWICLRLMRRSPALLATALFATQPFLFGSAFINQKDIPFMTLFMGVFALGLQAGNGRQPLDDQGTGQSNKGCVVVIREFSSRLRTEWQALEARQRVTLVAGSLVGLLLIADLSILGVLHRLGASIVVAAYNGRAPWPIQTLYTLVATDAYKTSLQIYLGKYDSFFAVLRFALIGAAIAAGTLTYSLELPSLGGILKGEFSRDRYPVLILGAVVLGCTIVVRQIGLFAGGLVSLYLLYRGRARAIPPLLFYWTIAALVAYATWPYLWSDPIENFTKSFTAIQSFGAQGVRFLGREYLAASLPWSYFPVLVGLDLTEPALALVILGFGAVLARVLRRRTDGVEFGLLALWLAVPVGWLMTQSVTIYDNIRQFFFVLPPLLIIAGVGLDALMQRVILPWQRGLLFALAMAPGVWGIVSLHPYEYSYFNSLAGGVSGAYGRFDMDYWCISIKEATQVVNQIADYGDRLTVLGPYRSALPYARPDLKRERLRFPVKIADEVVVCTNSFGGRWDSSGFRLVYQVRRGRAVFAEVWQRMAAQSSSTAPP